MRTLQRVGNNRVRAQSSQQQTFSRDMAFCATQLSKVNPWFLNRSRQQSTSFTA